MQKFGPHQYHDDVAVVVVLVQAAIKRCLMQPRIHTLHVYGAAASAAPPCAHAYPLLPSSLFTSGTKTIHIEKVQ